MREIPEIKIIRSPGKKTVAMYKGKTLLLSELADMHGINKFTVSRWARDAKSDSEFCRKFADVVYRHKRGLAQTATVFRRDGKAITSIELSKKLKISQSVASTRLRKWVSGKKTWEETVCPPNREKQALMQRLASNMNSNRIDTSKFNLGPRRSVDDLPGSGSWEKENLNPKTVGAFSRGGHDIAVSGGITIMTGD